MANCCWALSVQLSSWLHKSSVYFWTLLHISPASLSRWERFDKATKMVNVVDRYQNIFKECRKMFNTMKMAPSFLCGHLRAHEYQISLMVRWSPFFRWGRYFACPYTENTNHMWSVSFSFWEEGAPLEWTAGGEKFRSMSAFGYLTIASPASPASPADEGEYELWISKRECAVVCYFFCKPEPKDKQTMNMVVAELMFGITTILGGLGNRQKFYFSHNLWPQNPENLHFW